MLYKTAGEPCTIRVPLLVDGEYVVPDVGSVTSTLRGNDGTVLSTGSVTTTAATTDVSIEIDAEDNTKAVGKDFSNRVVILDFLVGGFPHQIKTHYRLIDWLTFTTSGEDVRGLLGVSSSELPDSVIELISAYFRVRTELGEAVLLAALAAGDDKARAADEAIACVAALDVIPSLQARVPQSEGDGVIKFTRALVNWEKAHRDISAKLSRALSKISGIVETSPVLGVLGVKTDPVTGA